MRRAAGEEPGRPSELPAHEEGVARLRRDVLRFLRLRERTAREVRDYLTRRGHAPEAIRATLAELREEGFVDDRRFAVVYLRDRQRLRPVSLAAVRRDLAARGVSREVIEEALAASDPPWEDARLAAELLARRWTRWPAEERERRGARLLRSRGFGPGAIRSALEAVGKDDTGAVPGDRAQG